MKGKVKQEVKGRTHLEKRGVGRNRGRAGQVKREGERGEEVSNKSSHRKTQKKSCVYL